ncbi:MAG: VIT domain-containing protein, partial [Rhodoferax sp.]
MSQIEYARLTACGGAPVMLLCVQVSGDLKGLLFEARVEQRFCNPTAHNMEVVYTFPLPWGAVLLGLEVQLGDRHLSAVVVEKKLAQAGYEEALSQGNAAIMLEKNPDLSFSLNLGNLAAQEHCIITLRYAQTLQFEQRGLRLLIPTVIAPRFGDAVRAGGLQPHQVPVHSLTGDYPFAIELRLHGDLAHARVACPSHPVGIAHALQQGFSVLTVSLGRSASLDRDFVLVIDQLAQTSVVVMSQDRLDPEGIAVMASFCPRLPVQATIPAAVKILVDCSGSMAGDSMKAAKRALQAIVGQLGLGDRFSLSRFGDHVSHRSRGLWLMTETTRLAAQRWVGSLVANLGGTEMESALTSTFALAQTVASDVLLVTDGEISAIDSTIKAAQASAHRVFVVGIGSSPAEAHLRRLAEATGGACDFVAPGEAVEPAILRMFARLRSPRLSALTLVWPEGFAPEWVTSMPPSVFDGDTVTLFALARQRPTGTVELRGQLADDADWLTLGSASFSTDIDPSDSLSRMAVAERLRLCLKTEDAVLPPVEARAFATKLALDYQLVTDETSFLLIHQRTEEDKPQDMPELHKVSQMLAAGWGGVGSARVHETSVGYGQSVDMGVRWSTRSSRVSPPVSLRRVDAADSFDIPMFCRKSVATYAPVALLVDNTPLSLCLWLRANPQVNWPASYLGLRDLGVDLRAVEWLELDFARNQAPKISEPTIVKSFLYAMAQNETLKALSLTDGAALGLKALARKLVRRFAKSHGQGSLGVDVQLAGKIAQALQGMTAASWPDQVFELDAEKLNL